VMPINRLFKKGKINPEEVERLDQAFAITLRSLSLVDRDDPICEMVARKVVDIDSRGTHDPKEIATIAAKEFGIRE
jgi:hypothetical protein